MTDLGSLLSAHVATLVPEGPRDFAPVRRRAAGRRRRQVLGAALAVVLVGAGSALAVTHSATGRTAVPVARPTTAPETVVVDGITLRRDTAVPFAQVVTTQRSDHQLLVHAGTRPAGGPTSCYPWSIPFVLSQDDHSVSIGVYDYAVFPAVKRTCLLVALGTADLSVELGGALGSRSVVDASTGRPSAVLDESTYLTSSELPSGFTDRRVGGTQNPGLSEPAFSQNWSRRSGQLSLVEGPPREVLREHVQHDGDVTVRGHAGEIVRTAGGDVNRCVRWQESPTDALELCSSGYTRDVLTISQLVAFADSLSRPGSSTTRSDPAPTLRVQGMVLNLVQDEPFGVAYLDPAHPRDLVVQRSDPPSVGGCFPWLDLHVVDEGASSVELALADYQVAKPRCVDATPSDAGAFLRVTLDRPLGTRTLLDAGTGAAALVIDPSQWLVPSYLPPTYLARGALSGIRGGGGATIVEQDFAGHHGDELMDLRQGQATAVLSGASLTATTVRGHPGIFSQEPGTTFPVRCLSWIEAPNDRVVLCTHGGVTRQLVSDSELLRIADGLHRP